MEIKEVKFQDVADKIQSLIAHYEPKISKMSSSKNSIYFSTKDIIFEVDPQRLLNTYKSRVAEAYRNRTIFSVHSSQQPVAQELTRRGWLEKLMPGSYSQLQSLPIESLVEHAKPGNIYETVIISKIIHHLPAFFIWIPFKNYHYNVDDMAYRNRMDHGDKLNFLTKVGLIGCAEQEHWYRKEGISEMNYPRCYRMGGEFEEREDFIDEFRRTQCRCLIQFITENLDKPTEIVDRIKGTVLPSVIIFALKNLRLQLMDIEHSLLDNEPYIDVTEWHTFIKDSTLVLQKKAKIRASLDLVEDYAITGSELLEQLLEKRPDYKWDGCQNIWILKPANLQRGNGIVVKNALAEIIRFTKKNIKRNYIVQKYVECPFLIYNTKFDIRQYMLVTITDTMVRIYLYKDCYLRFSTQKYTLDDLSRRAHVTNYTLQQRYADVLHDSRLPENLMWSLEEFLEYLDIIEAPANIWEEKIFPVFSRNVVAVILSSLEEMDFVKNTFELVGCDFMLDKDYNPFFIEFNKNPDLTPSTAVTEHICSMVQKDMIKVIVDLPENANAPIGKFQLVHEFQYKFENNYKPNTKFSISGKSIQLSTPNQSDI